MEGQEFWEQISQTAIDFGFLLPTHIASPKKSKTRPSAVRLADKHPHRENSALLHATFKLFPFISL
jgi:hypothetical protein